RLSREDFRAILLEMDGLPVVVRLLDPPLHEFLPDLVELSVQAAVAEAEGRQEPELEGRVGGGRGGGRVRGSGRSSSGGWRRCGAGTRRTRCSGCGGCGCCQ